MTDPTQPGRPITRRQVLLGGSMAGFAVFLAACGAKGTQTEVPGTQSPTTGLPTEGATVAPSVCAPSTESPAATLNWANWTYYMDVDPKDSTKFKTLEDFKAKYGTTVNYPENIDDNDTFVGTIRPQLQAGQDTTWDIITLTDWMAARLIRLGWVEQMDLCNMPNVTANLQDVYKGVSWDATNDHHVPWQSGMTGLGYDKAKTGALHSLASFFDPQFKGKVDYLTEVRDTLGLTMLLLGRDPAKATRADMDAAIAKVKEAKDAGIVRAFKGNAYAEDLKSGDAVLAMAWSGDIVVAQADKPTLALTIGDEGGMLWTDNCMIPKGAQHKYTAELMIDFCYQPAIAAQIEAYVNYICPVKGAGDVLKAGNPDVANNPLIFPPKDILDRLHIFIGLNEADEKYMNDQFASTLGL